MLTLTRCIGQEIVIGNDKTIKVKVVDVRGKKVSLGIEAPRNIIVDRLEVSERRAKENRILS